MNRVSAICEASKKEGIINVDCTACFLILDGEIPSEVEFSIISEGEIVASKAATRGFFDKNIEQLFLVQESFEDVKISKNTYSLLVKEDQQTIGVFSSLVVS